MKILYTPAGDSDPIRECHDGGILHCIRHLGIEKVVIFLSKEMSEKERERGIYSKAIKYTAPQCEVEFIFTEIVDVQHMEELVPLIEGFEKLEREHHQDELYLNLSSGTPQMKSIMSLLAIDYINAHAIQVDTPSRGSNRKAHPNQDNDDIDVIIGLNEDNEPDAPCRCYEANLDVLRFYSVKHQIISLIDNYEYGGAWDIYNKHRRLFSASTGKLLEQARLRQNLQLREAFKKDKIDRRDLIREYLLVMEICQKQGRLPEFIVKLTPFLYTLTFFYLGRKLKVKFEDICDGDRNHYRIGLRKCARNWQELSVRFGADFRDYTDLSFTNMLLMLEVHKQTEPKLLQGLTYLREVERKNRNQTAHTIVSLTEADLRNIEPHWDSKRIMQELKQVFRLVMEGERVPSLNVYDALNKEIEKSLASYTNLRR